MGPHCSAALFDIDGLSVTRHVVRLSSVGPLELAHLNVGRCGDSSLATCQGDSRPDCENMTVTG